MTIWTVFAPPGRGGALEEADDLAFIPEGFSWGALLVPPLWAIARRSWVAFVLWLAVMLILGGLAPKLGETITTPLALLFGLWFAFAAQDIRRFMYDVGGWRLIGLVEAGSLRDAEMRFFTRETLSSEAAAGPASSPPLPPPSGARPDLFPPMVGFWAGERS